MNLFSPQDDRRIASRNPTRRVFLRHLALAAAVLPGTGCLVARGGPSRAELVWGQRGISPGKIQKPRAMCIDAEDNLYLVDITARIQVFDTEGAFLRGWRTPESKNGRPTGMSIINGKLYVADTHYFRVLVYTLEGELLEDESFGAAGNEPGNLGWTTDVVQDSAGNLYVSEYGQHDRIQKFAPDGQFILQWGTHGTEPGQFIRPQSMCVDGDDQIWVCDAGNHRLQRFDTEGKLIGTWGQKGSEAGEISYPYSVLIDSQGNVVVCEFGNSRVQKFDPQGRSLALWGSQGREPGQLHNPWSIAQDSRNKTYVLDSYNHRVQRFEI